jgi:hypothetical protein
MSGPARTAVYGPEAWRRVCGAVWSYWDLWFAVVAVADHDGDLDALAAAIDDGKRSFGSATVEAKLSHLDDLMHRLSEAAGDARVLAGDTQLDTRVRGRPVSTRLVKNVGVGQDRRGVGTGRRAEPACGPGAHPPEPLATPSRRWRAAQRRG